MLLMASFKKSLIVEQFQGNYLKLQITVITQISAAFGGNLISAAAFIRVNTVLRAISMVLSAALK